MTITNRTSVSTDKLTRLLIEAHRRLGLKRTPKLTKLQVRFYWSRREGLSSGGAILGGTEMRVGVRRGEYGPVWNAAEVARTLDHELRHIYGLSHDEMGHDAASYRTSANLARFYWAFDLMRQA